VLPLQVRNLTEHNFREVRVTIRVGGSARAWWEAPEKPELPTPPRPYGPQTSWLPNFGADIRGLAAMTRIPDLGALMHDVNLQPLGRIKNGGSFEVEYVALDLRPGETEALDDVLMLVRDADIGKSIDVSWRATATNVSGTSSDSFSLDVSPDAASPENLLGADLDDLDERGDDDESDDDEERDDDG
jgi:hypothetical protein